MDVLSLFGKYADLQISREFQNFFLQNVLNTALSQNVIVVFVKKPLENWENRTTVFVSNTALWVLKLFGIKP